MKLAPLFGDHPIGSRAICQFLSVNPMIDLRVAHWLGGKRGTVHIFNGRTEYIEKYYDVIEQFLIRGFNVTAHDWRGQGLSTRNDLHPNRCHIEDFAFHQSDARAVMQFFSNLEGPHFLFCHSMGGAIGARYLTENNGIEAAIFSAPMFGIALPNYLKVIRPYLMSFIKKFGLMWNVAPGTREQNYESYTRFSENMLTSDESSWNSLVRNTKNWPDIHCGGPTYYWAEAAYKEMEVLNNAARIPTPALVFLGTEEQVVEPSAIKAKMDRQDNWRLVELENARHESYLETPEIRKKMWLNIDLFFDQYA